MPTGGGGFPAELGRGQRIYNPTHIYEHRIITLYLVSIMIHVRALGIDEMTRTQTPIDINDFYY
jgi:hypothetical protein